MAKKRRTGEVGVIYLLCIEPPLHHARHYLGWAKGDDPSARIAEHRRGQGSPLIKAALAAGREVTHVLSLTGTRDDERAMKNQRNRRRFCPRCVARYRHEKRAKDAAYRIKRTKESSDESRTAGDLARVGGDALHDPDAGHVADGDPRP